MDPAELSATDLPVRFGRYELQRVIGEGGMGRVFAADLLGPAGFRKKVAIKVLRKELRLRDGGEAGDLAREARLGGLVSHPNVVETWELGEVRGQLFLAMALVDGPSVLEVVRRHGPLPPRALVEVGMHLAAGLAHIHAIEVQGASHGLLHCDVKPSNVLLDARTGQARLADLGVAALRSAVAERSDRRGTPSYMSPEQVSGGALDGRSDLFALGTVLWEAATGRRLFRRETAADASVAILKCDETVPPLLAALEPYLPGLGDLVGRCLRADPSQRFPDGRSVQAALDALLPSAAGASISEIAGGPATPAPTPTTSISRGARLDPDAPTVLGRPPTNLGAEPDAFVGREADLGHLGALFDERGARIVTLKGAGGTGKTRLSRRFAVHALGSFAGGAWFCELTEARTPQQALFAVAGVLGVPIVGANDDALPAHLGHAIAGRGRVLLVLDNLEQLVEVAAPIVATWLELAPEARFLVTSREPLRIAGEQVVELGPLPTDEAVALLTARAALPGPWTDDEPALRAIAARLDGLPLALELAAARARVLAPAQLLERLGVRLDLLRSGRRGAAARQATLRGAIDWSWSMLEPWEQAAMVQLSVFRGGFFLDDAEEVLDLSPWPMAPWQIDVVDALWSRSLLVSRAIEGRPRFAMYEAIREYAAEGLDPADPVRDRHARRYAQLGAPDRITALSRPTAADQLHLLALEVDNLVAATARALERGAATVAARAALAAGNVFVRTGPYDIGLELLVRVLSFPTPAADRADLVALACGTAVNAGRLEVATRIAEEALRDGAGDLVLEGVAKCGLASAVQARGDAHAALILAREACDRFERAGAADRLAHAHALTGRIQADFGAYAEAERCQREALVLARRIGDRALEGATLGGIGLVRQYQGDDCEAELLLREAAIVLAELGDRPRLGRVRGNLAIAARRLGRHDDARREYQAAIALYREIGSRSDEALALQNLGILYRMEGELDAAERHFRDAEAIAAWIGNERVLALARGNLGLVHRSRADLPAARAAFEETIAVADRLSLARLAAVYREDLGVLLVDMGELLPARASFEAALARLEAQPDPSVYVSGLSAYARCLFFLGETDEAERKVRWVVEQTRASPTRTVEADAWCVLARIRHDLGDDEGAARHVATALEAVGHVQRIQRAGILTLAAEIAVARGAFDAARQALDEGLSFAGRGDVELSLRLAVVRGALSAQAGDTVTARRALEAAIDALEAKGLAIAAIDARASRAAVAGRLGLDPEEDRRAIGRWIDRMGCSATPLVRHVGSR